MTAGATDQRPASGSAIDDLVTIELSATTDHLRLVRLVVVALATRHGADVDDIDDLRVAADEVCAHLIDGARSDDRLRVEVGAGPAPDGGAGPVVSFRAATSGGAAVEPIDELRALVVSATTDRHGIEGGDGAGPGATVWFERALRAAGDDA